MEATGGETAFRSRCSFAYSALACFQDGNVEVGVLPEGEEVLVSRASFGGVALQLVGAAKCRYL